MLLSVFNLLMRWLFFVAIIWPVQAEATSSVLPVQAVKNPRWIQPHFNVALPENIKENVCHLNLVFQYFKVEKDFMNFSLFYINHHISVLKAFHNQLELDFLNKNKKKSLWNSNVLEVQHLAEYIELTYTVSDKLSVAFEQLEACWKLRPNYFLNLKKVINNYRSQEALIAEVMLSFFNNLSQIFMTLDAGNLSVKSKQHALDSLESIWKTSEEMQTMVLANYKFLFNELEYNLKIYEGI